MINKFKRYIAILLLSCFFVSTSGYAYGKHLSQDGSNAQITQQQDTTKVIVQNDKQESEIKETESDEVIKNKPSYSSVLSLNFVFYLIYKYTFREL